MGKILKGIGALLLVVAVGAGVYLKTPATPKFDRQAAIEAAKQYDARIIRDRFGVPHIYGKRDADVAFGIAYAHLQDDWETFQNVLFFSRGSLAQQNGRDAAIPDYLIRALQIPDDVRAKNETDLSPETRAIMEAYAAGANLYCAGEKGRCAPGAAPITPYDIVAGFTARTPFFYGLDQQLTEIFEGDVELSDAARQMRETFLKTSPGFETGSNAMAVSPKRSADGHTRLFVNSHQPYTGPVAWYEVRAKSEEGWDMIGGVFPGAPLILHGAGPALGWAFTVNKPDLVDAFLLTVDNPKKPTQYMFDGAWRYFEVYWVEFRVKLFGPFSLPVKRRALKSVHGPVFVTDNGVFAVSYAGAGDIRAAEQWYRMNKATTFAEWKSAMEMRAIPNFNVIFANGEGTIAYFYNAAIPIRTHEQDPSKALPGDTSETVWRGLRPYSEVPQVIDPASGYVVNANHSPFKASGEADNPHEEDFPPSYGIDRRVNNRGLRIQTLYGGDASITAEEFIAYKFDHMYAEDSKVMALVRDLLTSTESQEDETLQAALEVLADWDGSVAKENRSAALAVLTAQHTLGQLMVGEDASISDALEALRQTAADLEAGFGRLDPEWGEVVRLNRGDVDLPINGGPDTLRAVYPDGEPADGPMKANGGDTYIVYADWAAPNEVSIKTIHQFGSATIDGTSPHYDDQAPIFAADQFKTPPMDLEALLAEATSDVRIGGD
jgi:acyl-homoserine-lactone acylase